MPSAGEEDGVTGTLEHVKSSVARTGGMAQEAETQVRSSVVTHLLTSLNLPVSSLAPDSTWNPVAAVLTGAPQYTVDGNSRSSGTSA